MKREKLALIGALFVVFSALMGLQAAGSGRGFFAAFIVTLVFSALVFFIQIQYYFITVKNFVANGEGEAAEYAHPFDIWLAIIPMAALAAVAYLVLNWRAVQVFYCTMLSLIGMISGDALGRGSKKWSVKKSLPFFVGVIAATAFAFIAEAMLR